MRKFYFLIAMFALAIVANAQVLINYEHAAAPTDGITLGGTTVMKSVKIHANADAVDCIQLANSYVSSGALTGNDIKLSVEGGLKAGDVISFAGFINNKDEAKYASTVIYVKDDTEAGYTKLWESEQFPNAYFVADEPTVQSYTLEADYEAVYFGRNGNTGADFYTITVTRPESAPAETPVYTFSATVPYVFNNYVIDEVYYPAAEIASQLGLADTAALYELIKTNTAFYLELPDGTRTNENFSDPNQPWMNAEGVNQGYGDAGTCWFAGIAAADAEDGTPSVNAWIGDMPGFFENTYTETNLTAKFYLVNGDKEVAFVFNLTVEAAPKPLDIPEPARNLSELTILKEYTLTMDFTEGKTDDHTVTVDMSDISEVLGVSEEAIAQNIKNIFLTQGVVTDEAGSVSFSDSLSVYPFTNDGWFGRYTSFDEATGNEEAIVQNGPTRWGSGATFYLHNLALAEGEFSMLVGAYASTMKVGAEDFAELYIVAGNKAVKLTVKVNIIPLETTSFADMTKVGEQTIKAVSKPGDYAVVNVPFDLNAVKEALGIESVDEITQWVFASDDAIVDPASNNDFWQNEQGITNAWGSDACAKVYPAEKNINNGQFTLMQMAGKYTSITEPAGPFTLKYLFIVGSKYYQFNFEYTVNPNFEEEEYNIVGEDVINMQMIPSTDAYQYSKETQLDFNYFKELLGTDNFRLYGEKYSQAKGVYLDNSTTCDDGDAKGAGFWYKNDKHENKYGEEVVTGDGWGNNSFGFQLSKSGVITWFQVPNNRQVGDSFLANIYFVNEETKDAVRVKLYVKFVDEETADVVSVGEENINIIAAEAEADGMYRVSYDMTNAIEALGIDEEELEAVQVVAPRSLFSYSYISNGEDVLFDEHGYATENEEKITSIAQIEIDGKTATITIDPMDINLDSEEATSIIVRFGFEINGKRYLQNITIGNPATGINAVNTLASAQTIYTVNGVKVAALQRGLNIVKLANGSVKKVLVK